MFTIFAGIYFFFPKITGKMLNERLGKWNFWLMYIGFNATFMPMHVIGLLGMSRRINAYAPDYAGTNLFISLASVVLTASYVVFMVNVVWSLRKGQAAGVNPWGARTLDWSTQSPPPHGNFYREPVVTSGPYDFTVPAPYFGPPLAPGSEQLQPLDEKILRRKGFRKVS